MYVVSRPVRRKTSFLLLLSAACCSVVSVHLLRCILDHPTSIAWPPHLRFSKPPAPAMWGQWFLLTSQKGRCTWPRAETRAHARICGWRVSCAWGLCHIRRLAKCSLPFSKCGLTTHHQNHALCRPQCICVGTQIYPCDLASSDTAREVPLFLEKLRPRLKVLVRWRINTDTGLTTGAPPGVLFT